MAETFFPFDEGAGADVTEDQWRKMARLWLPTGVISGEEGELAVSERAAGAAMSVDVAAGAAWLQGHYYESDAVEEAAINDADPDDDRIDRIVIAADFVANTVGIEVLEGTPDPAPAAPALTQLSGRWEISLAQVLVGAAASSILDADITDERIYDTHIAHGEFEGTLNVDNQSSGTSHLVATSGRRHYDGSEVQIDVYVPFVARAETGATNPSVFFGVYDGGAATEVKRAGRIQAPGVVILGVPFRATVFDTPSEGEHAYQLRAFVNSADRFTVQAGAAVDAFTPAFIRVRRA